MVITAGPVLSPRCFLAHPSSDRLAYFPEGSVIATSSGRGAILACLRAFSVPRGSVALLPSYLCPSVLEPFRAHGCRTRFYEVSEHLEPRMERFSQLLDQTAASVVFIIHYFGFPMPNFEELISYCRDRNILVIEDCAHALFSRYRGRLLGDWGDGAVFSLRKVLPLPEGGFAVMRRGTEVTRLEPRLKASEFWKLLRELLYWADASTGFSLRGRLLGFASLRRWIEGANASSSRSSVQPLGKLSYLLLKRMCLREIVRRRCENYQYLADCLKTTKRVVLLYPSLPEGICPVGLPLLTGGRDQLRNALYRKGIATRAYWDILPEEVAHLEEAQRFSRQILVLPIHEGLSRRQLDFLGAEVVSLAV